jgi:hypothetical protein
VLVLAGGMTDAASGVRWTVGERVFADGDVWQNLCGIELHCDQVAREARRIGPGDDDDDNPRLVTSGLE